ncbi:MAG: metalloregulator ArsR/SmtB family transcription factor [Candidatus Saccharimonadales bacterium]
MSTVCFDDFFAVLSNKQRLNILRYIEDNGPSNVTDIAAGLEVEQSSISHSVKRLLLCHFVTVEQKGKERVYSLDQATVEPLLGLIEKHVRAHCVKECAHSK